MAVACDTHRERTHVEGAVGFEPLLVGDAARDELVSDVNKQGVEMYEFVLLHRYPTYAPQRRKPLAGDGTTAARPRGRASAHTLETPKASACVDAHVSADDPGPSLGDPEPADDWPDGPLTRAEARTLLDRADVVAVWERPPDEKAHASLLAPDDPDDAVVELVIETPTEYRLYGYARRDDGGAAWMDYGAAEKGTDAAETMLDAFESYRLLVGSAAREADDPDADAVDAAEAAVSGESVDADDDADDDPAAGDPGHHPR